MAKVSSRCSTCRHTGEIEAFSSINVAERPSLKEKVKDGSLFVWECPQCGARNLAVYQTVYHDPAGKLMIWLLPGDTPIDSRLEGISPEGYTLRRVSDVGSLVEKVNIFDAGLDDFVMEMCKHVTRMELSEKQGPAVLEAPLKFYRLQGADHEIVFSFPFGGNMHEVSVGFNVYEDCAAILQRNPGIRPPSGFASVDSALIQTYFK